MRIGVITGAWLAIMFLCCAEPMVETFDTLALSHGGKELLIHHVAYTGRSTAVTGAIHIIFETVAVIVGELFSCRDSTSGTDPDVAMDHRHLAIRITAMIEKPRQIPLDTPVDITAIVESKRVKM